MKRIEIKERIIKIISNYNNKLSDDLVYELQELTFKKIFKQVDEVIYTLKDIKYGNIHIHYEYDYITNSIRRKII